jgi:hypothetical protein
LLLANGLAIVAAILVVAWCVREDAVGGANRQSRDKGDETGV